MDGLVTQKGKFGSEKHMRNKYKKRRESDVRAKNVLCEPIVALKIAH